VGNNSTPAPAHLQWSPNIKSESRVHCLIELTRRSRIEVPRVGYENIGGNKVSGSSEFIRARMQAAQNIQQARFPNSNPRLSKTESSNIISNADMRIAEVRKFCHLQDEGQSLMRAAMNQLNLSARAYHRMRSVKLARTTTDLAGSEDIQSTHLAEALQYRPKLTLG
jgi:magnesium chelatase family protein